MTVEELIRELYRMPAEAQVLAGSWPFSEAVTHVAQVGTQYVKIETK